MDHERKQGRRPRWKVLAACILCLFAGAAAALAGTWLAIGEEGVTLLQAQRLIDEKFVGDYDEELHRELVLGAMVAALDDRWSYYLPREEYEQVMVKRQNSYVGIGVTVDSAHREGILIRSVTAGGPAEEAGLLPGEIIRAVEGQEITPENWEDCFDAIVGEEGTVVVLEAEAADGSRRSLEITRRTIQVIPASWEMLPEGVGLIRIENFYVGTADLVAQGVEELTAQGARALILDVRNNPGGFVSELTQLLDCLLPEGEVFISRDHRGVEEVYTSDGETFTELPLAVLVNGESYSAAEFLAAQLRESAGAVVVGTQTCGKGFAQTLIPLADGGAVNLSTSRYFTGSGVSLIGVGVEPDAVAELPEEAEEALLMGDLPVEEDLQLRAALEALEQGN